jgi:hypothetical protein
MLLVNNLVDYWIERTVWWWLQIYFSPYRIPTASADMQDFLSHYSLNGICRR